MSILELGGYLLAITIGIMLAMIMWHALGAHMRLLQLICRPRTFPKPSPYVSYERSANMGILNGVYAIAFDNEAESHCKGISRQQPIGNVMSTESRNPITREAEIWKCGLAYLALLEISHDSLWRLQNQDIYCRLKDHIAALTHQEPERIQDEFEAKAKP